MITTKRIEELLEELELKIGSNPYRTTPIETLSTVSTVLRNLHKESTEEDRKSAAQAMKKFHRNIDMTFGEVIEALQSGHTVTRKAWNKDGEDITYLSMITIRVGDKTADTICASYSVNIMHDIIHANWSASTEDILADDWYIVK